MTQPVPPNVRQCHYSRAVTPSADVHAVLGNCRPLLEWLQDAASEADMYLRFNALDEYHTCLLRDCSVPVEVDDPIAFLRAAQVFYSFMSAEEAA